MKKKHKIYRDASSGEFTSKEDAEVRPAETVSEVVETGSDNKTPSRNTEDGEGETADSVAE